MQKPSLTVVILTYNEERHIERCLRSVRNIAQTVFIVDSFSNDRTVELAQASGAQVFQNAFLNQAQQFQWALDNCPIETAWVMRLDADEVVEEKLRDKVIRDLDLVPRDVVGIHVDRKHIFMGRWIRYGGRYPITLLRIWRRGHGHIENRWMDEHIFVSGGRTISFGGGLADVNLNDLTFFTAKHNAYATREAVEQLSHRYGLFVRDLPKGMSASRQTHVKKWIKEHVYNWLPFWSGPLAYFLYRYFIQLGFLDGRSGLVYHFLQGFWYRFLVGAKTLELDRQVSIADDNAARIARIEQLTGLALTDHARTKSS